MEVVICVSPYLTSSWVAGAVFALGGGGGGTSSSDSSSPFMIQRFLFSS